MGTYTFTNNSGITIGDMAVQSQGLAVSGMLGAITNVQINLNGLTHGWASDLDMLLQAPDGLSNLEFWSDVSTGFPSDLFNATFVISDSASQALPAGSVTGGVFRPADYDATAEVAGDFGISNVTINHPGSTGTSTLASAFANSGNGTWLLYIRDDDPVVSGSLAGWSLTITTNDVLGGSSDDDDVLSIVSTGA